MRISSLSVYNNITLDKSRKRTGRIVRLTPHCYVGQVSAERGVDYLAKKPNASVNYVVDKDGRVGCNIPEDFGAWTSSSKSNDEIAITFELACESKNPYMMNKACVDGFIRLVVDICKRYKRNHVVYKADKDAALAYKPKNNEFIITLHRWFSSTACPGEWFMKNAEYIVSRINKELDGKNTSNKVSGGRYTIQLGAFSNKENACELSNGVEGSFILKVDNYYKVFIGKGSRAEMIVKRSKGYPDGIVKQLPCNGVEVRNDVITVGSIVRLEYNCPIYGSTRKFSNWVYSKDLYVRQISGNRVVVSTLKEGDITGAVDIKYVKVRGD